MLESPSAGDSAWAAARNALKRIQPGDAVVATLPGHRVGKVGNVVALEVADSEWNPIVAPRANLPRGENGRRILVRWDLTCGPDDPAKVVLLPPPARFNSGQARATIRQIPLDQLSAIKAAMRDDSNWVSLAGAFALETALSDYIAAHPWRLESGMIAHPSLQVRELTFADKRRADVLLQDRLGRAVIAECKQGTASLDALEQVIHYRDELRAQHPEIDEVRALVVHGGSSRVTPEVADASEATGVELVHFELQVNFMGSRS